MNISELQNKFIQAELDVDSVEKSPIDQFRIWFDQILELKLKEPNAMVLATVGSDNIPSQRTVLLKAYDEKGFVFYTNYTSRKALEIDNNNAVSLLFPWIPLERQVRVTGYAEKVSAAESVKYFLSRPYGSQLGAWVSHQSEVITSRSLLLTKWTEMKKKFKKGQVPLPDFWGGYRVSPTSIEFWQGRPNRLHDRIEYNLNRENWDIQRLAP